jgi:hypothetical protein
MKHNEEIRPGMNIMKKINHKHNKQVKPVMNIMNKYNQSALELSVLSYTC